MPSLSPDVLLFLFLFRSIVQQAVLPSIIDRISWPDSELVSPNGLPLFLPERTLNLVLNLKATNSTTVRRGSSDAVTVDKTSQEAALRDQVRDLKLQLQHVQADLAAAVKAEVQAHMQQKGKELHRPTAMERVHDGREGRKRQQRARAHSGGV